MSEMEILAYNIGGITVREATTITFLSWLAKKLNNTTNNKQGISELTSMIMNPPMGKMSDDNKIHIFRKLETLQLI